MPKIRSILDVPGETLVDKLIEFGPGRFSDWREFAFVLRCAERAAELLHFLPLDQDEWLHLFEARLTAARRSVLREIFPRDLEAEAEQVADLISYLEAESLSDSERRIAALAASSLEMLFLFMHGAADFHEGPAAALDAAVQAGYGDDFAAELTSDFDQLAFQGEDYDELGSLWPDRKPSGWPRIRITA